MVIKVYHKKYQVSLHKFILVFNLLKRFKTLYSSLKFGKIIKTFTKALKQYTL